MRTDLGLLRTKAVKQADGSYKISGTKIFISPASTFTENIIHLVLPASRARHRPTSSCGRGPQSGAMHQMMMFS